MIRPVIAVDIDNVLVASRQYLVDELNHRFGTAFTIEDEAVVNLRQAVVETTGQDADFVMATIQYFMLGDGYTRLEPLPGAVEALGQLQQHYRIMTITARSPEFQPGTRRWLDQWFDGLIVEQLYPNRYGMTEKYLETVDKSRHLRDVGARWLIDDEAYHFHSLPAGEIQGILFGDYIWNRAIQVPTTVKRAPDWTAVLAGLMPGGLHG